MWLVHVG
jgi:NADPH:quinone reductase-like Zn-dependent oxidoreductase